LDAGHRGAQVDWILQTAGEDFGAGGRERVASSVGSMDEGADGESFFQQAFCRGGPGLARRGRHEDLWFLHRREGGEESGASCSTWYKMDEALALTRLQGSFIDRYNFMSGKKRFDIDRAIDRATRLFWAKGYSNTSVRDLLAVMEIGEGSFYNSVESKANLYLLCLKHYHGTVTARRVRAFLSEPTAKGAVRRFFKEVLDDLDDPKIPNVCLMAGSLANDVLDTGVLRKYVLAEMRTLQGVLTQRLEAARESGELTGKFQPDVAARVIVTYLQGFFRVVRVLQSRTEMEQQIDALLIGLGL
jgi:TetR/AcrR family transcriptional repressor of nem operon